MLISMQKLGEMNVREGAHARLLEYIKGKISP
jgi:hypothetical protein